MTANRDLAKLTPLPSNSLSSSYASGIGWVNSPASQNMLMNANFAVNQRVFSGGALAAGNFGHDRWGAYNGGANYTVSNGTVTLTSGTIVQVVEANIGNAFALRTFTLSVENPSGLLNVTLGNGTGANSVSGTITAGAGRRGVTLTVPSGVSADLKVRISGSGVIFKRPKLELGSAITEFEDTNDLVRCQRFYQKSYYQTTAPGSGGSSNYPGMVDYFAPSATTAQINVFVKLGVTMRAVPTITLYDLAGTAGFVYRGSNGQSGSVFAVGDGGFNGVALAGASATEFAFHWTAGAEIACTD